MPESTPRERRESFDEIASDLRALRDAAGPVSYADLVRRITKIRLARGVHAAAAIPARSTVYNVFQSGRTRLDPELLRDVVTALGEHTDAAEAWVERSRKASRTATTAVSPTAKKSPRSTPIFIAPAAVCAHKPAPGIVALLLISCVVVNLLGLYTANVFKLSVYLDMVGTAIASIVLGPWHGVAVAVATNGLGILAGDAATIPFMPVNIVGALIWGYGVRRFHLGATISRYMSLSLLAAVGCSLVAAPIVLAVFHGGAGHASEQTVLSLEAMQVPFFMSVLSTNIITSILDKMLTGFIALAAFTLLYNKAGFVAEHMPVVEKLGSLRVGRMPAKVRLGRRMPVRA